MAAVSNGEGPKQMPVGGKVITGSATGQPQESSKITYGNDLRSGKGKDNFKNK